MWRLAAVVLVVACGGPHPRRSEDPVRSLPPQEIPGPPAQVSPHGSSIVALAVAAAGDAAVTCDGDGTCRLWPRLDSTHEPFVITLPAVRRLAVSRLADGFAVAVSGVELDPSGTILAFSGDLLQVFERDGSARFQIRTGTTNIEQVMLSTGGATLVVATRAAILAFDATTGQRVARACAWAFGLHDQPVQEPADGPCDCVD